MENEFSEKFTSSLRGCSIIHFNFRSICKHINGIHTLEYKFDITAVSETRIKDNVDILWVAIYEDGRPCQPPGPNISSGRTLCA